MAAPRAALTAYRTPSGIYLSRDTFVALPWRDRKGRTSPKNAVLNHHLYFKGEIERFADSDSNKVLGNAVLRILSRPEHDTTGLGYDDVDRSEALLLQAFGVKSHRALWKIADMVCVSFEEPRANAPALRPISMRPQLRPKQDTWMGLRSIPTLHIEFSRPTHLGEALRRAFVFCDMSAPA